MRVKIGPYPNHRFYHNWLYKWFGYSPKQKISVKIHKYDTWSMDNTLAPIILPMLKQLKETKHGSPSVSMLDIPTSLHATREQLDQCEKTGETDPQFFERWDWILEEIIWAFEQKCRDDWEGDYYGENFEWFDRDGMKEHQNRMSNGFRLFGKYFESMWD